MGIVLLSLPSSGLQLARTHADLPVAEASIRLEVGGLLQVRGL